MTDSTLKTPAVKDCLREKAMLPRLMLVIAVLLSATAFVPLLPVNWWWVRIGDFPRVQLTVAYAIGFVALIPFYRRRLAKTAMVLMVMSILVQMYWISPYLPFSHEQVESAKSDDPGNRLRILTANVLQDNDQAQPLLQLIEQQSPDIVVVCEVNQRWIEQLDSLRKEYAHTELHPLENKYGIALYSRFEIVTSQVRGIVKKSIPSIDATVRLPSGQQVRVFAIHPNPPRPGEDTTKRDAELILVGREVAKSRTAIVLGDMNDVGWSRTTNLFQEVSGLLDPRRGRGLYPTFNADSWIWRYPLDHLFHSNNFRVVDLRVLPPIGSDHLPLWVELSLEPDAERTQQAPDLDAGDKEDADEAVEALREPGALEQPPED